VGGFAGSGARLPPARYFRAKWLRLREWLDNDDAILEFFFPQGLPSEDRGLLQQDMALLREQSWDAALADWPENEAERPYTLEHAEAALIEACDEFMEMSGIKC
jgi:hypothetical protein